MSDKVYKASKFIVLFPNLLSLPSFPPFSPLLAIMILNRLYSVRTLVSVLCLLKLVDAASIDFSSKVSRFPEGKLTRRDQTDTCPKDIESARDPPVTRIEGLEVTPSSDIDPADNQRYRQWSTKISLSAPPDTAHAALTVRLKNDGTVYIQSILDNNIPLYFEPHRVKIHLHLRQKFLGSNHFGYWMQVDTTKYCSHYLDPALIPLIETIVVYK